MGVPIQNAGFEVQELIINPFAMHLSDAILAAHLGIDVAGMRDEVRSMLFRTAVSHSVFALESAANAFLASIPQDSPLMKKLLEEVDMRHILRKFEIFLLSRPGTPRLPTGDHRFKVVKKLIDLRHAFVHSRAAKHPLQPSSNPTAAFGIHRDPKELEFIPPMSWLWKEEDAKRAIGGVLDFLRLYISLASLSPEEVQIALLTHFECPDGKRVADIANLHRLLGLGSALNLDTSFLTHPDPVILKPVPNSGSA